MTNTPPNIIVAKTKENFLPIHEHFYTLQGEGAYAGHAAYFIRLGGCDVGCVWCDVPESWDMAAHPLISIDVLVGHVIASGTKIAVITGGEPLMHNLDLLTKALKEAGVRCHIETSGTHPLTGIWDWVCFSPKKFMAPLPEVAAAAHELKVIIFNKSDFGFAEKYTAYVPQTCKLLLQVEWGKREVNTPMMVAYVKENPKWAISVQTHKYLDIP